MNANLLKTLTRGFIDGIILLSSSFEDAGFLKTLPRNFPLVMINSPLEDAPFDSFYKIVWPTEILSENACEMLLRRIDGFNAPPRRIRADCHVIPPEK